jgi:CBS-domain-containing membrane protein
MDSFECLGTDSNWGTDFVDLRVVNKLGTKKTPWSESASELYRPSDRSLSAKLVQTFADRGCHVVRVTDPYGRILGFLDRNWILTHSQKAMVG